MLFTGDIEEIAEKKIIEKYTKSDILNCNILKVAHHGSKSSSIQEIIDKVMPQIAVIGVGEDNMYGHPNNDVISRLENVGSKVFRTDLSGEIDIFINSRGQIKIKKFIKK